MYARFSLLTIAALVFGTATISQAVENVRLLSVTGQQGDDDQVSFPDQTLFEINMDDAEPSFVATLTFVPEAHTIGFNPDSGLLHHTAGAESWTNDPNRSGGVGFRDHQYMETVNLNTLELTAIFNANGPESPDELPSFGLAAPRPTWVAPEEQRLIDQVEPEFRVTGENEYHAIRGLTWSTSEKLFYGSDEDGYFRLTADGQSTYVGPNPRDGAPDPKGIGFYTNGEGETVLLSGHRRNGEITVIDTTTGEPIGDPVLPEVPAGRRYDVDFGGLYAIAQHPNTGVVYGIRNVDEDDAYARELITLNPETGETTFIGELGLHFTSLAFVFDTPDVLGDFNNDGVLDATDINDLTQQSAGGTNPAEYDLTGDGLVNADDVTEWIRSDDIFYSWLGDSDLDGEFKSDDVIQVLSENTYEQDVDAVWTSGDWNGSGRFDSQDVIDALADGGYENGVRTDVASVPEPSAVVLLTLGALTLLGVRRQRTQLTNFVSD